ncbi:MAG TPA: carboxylating nicotinate-nucleotide diphosphorylase [Clostridiales bacterium]|jgi:nicotinate-nucleotide pyrophosphorylase (carboxylating)|nr:carboxylating nicotinate-nucleotide diphosphorylase [Clostridiales bacterium]
MYHLGHDEFIKRALDEDIGTGDITTISCIPENAVSRGVFKAKEPGLICGMDILIRVFTLLDPSVVVTPFVTDGTYVERGAVIAEISGNSRSILSGERVALNLVQRLSGIATRTFEAVKQVSGTKAVIVDTRKTTPGLRVLEKYAVKTGGGRNHRFNLADGVLIKDNHIKAAGGIREAVVAVRKTAPHTLKIEVEVETMEQIDEALAAGADIIMLDNMGLEEMAAAVKRINGRALVEASGNMGERNLREVAETGVDFISIGALTHTVKALDISLKFFE